MSKLALILVMALAAQSSAASAADPRTARIVPELPGAKSRSVKAMRNQQIRSRIADSLAAKARVMTAPGWMSVVAPGDIEITPSRPYRTTRSDPPNPAAGGFSPRDSRLVSFKVTVGGRHASGRSSMTTFYPTLRSEGVAKTYLDWLKLAD